MWHWVILSAALLLLLLTTSLLLWGQSREAPQAHPTLWRHHLLYGPRKFMLQHGWGHLRPQRCAELLRRLQLECQRDHIEFCLSEGTALGAIRDQEFIAGDTDVDVALWPRDFAVFRTATLPRLLRDQGFVLLKDRQEEQGLRYGLVTLGWQGETLDVGALFPGGYCCTRPGPCDEVIPHLQRWQRARLGHDEYWVPGEELLVALYGPDWRTPRTREKPQEIG